jgi:hypothetical protein
VRAIWFRSDVAGNGCQTRVSPATCRSWSEVFCLVELRGLEPLTPCLQRWWPRQADLQPHRSSVLSVAPWMTVNRRG